MSIRDEVQRMIEQEKAKLAQRDELLADREARKKAIFLPVRTVLDHILSAAAEFGSVSYHSTGAWVKVGRELSTGRKAVISWNVGVDFRRDSPDWVDREPYFIVEEERFYDFHGFQPNETSSSKKEFRNESELAEYLAATFAKCVASFHYSDARDRKNA